MRLVRKSWIAVGLIAAVLVAGALSYVLVERNARSGDEVARYVGPAASPSVPAESSENAASQDRTKQARTPEGDQKGEGKTGEPPLPQNVSPADQMQRVARVFGIDLNQSFKTDQITRNPPYGAESRRIETQDGKHLGFDAKTGQLITFFEAEPEDVPAGLTKDNAIPKEKALETARQLLKRLEVSAEFDENKVQYRDSVEEVRDDLKGAEWSVSGVLKYKNIPYFGSGVRVVVSAYSGKVLAYSYRAVGPAPERLDEKIDSSQATEAATAFLKSKSPEAAMEMRGQPQKIIALPNNFWTHGQGEPLRPAEKSRLCWLVNMIPAGGGYPFMVFVDAETGEICGGMG